MRSRSSVWRQAVVAVISLILLAGCSGGSGEETTTTVAETTTTSSAPDATTTTPPVAAGYEWVPGSVGICEEDLAAIEKMMADHPLSEVEGADHRAAFSALLKVLMAECRSDVMERWSIETYQIWLAGHSITPGKVPVDIAEWPQEWRDARSSGSGG